MITFNYSVINNCQSIYNQILHNNIFISIRVMDGVACFFG